VRAKLFFDASAAYHVSPKLSIKNILGFNFGKKPVTNIRLFLNN
jgi:hypothetical protein